MEQWGVHYDVVSMGQCEVLVALLVRSLLKGWVEFVRWKLRVWIPLVEWCPDGSVSFD